MDDKEKDRSFLVGAGAGAATSASVGFWQYKEALKNLTSYLLGTKDGESALSELEKESAELKSGIHKYHESSLLTKIIDKVDELKIAKVESNNPDSKWEISWKYIKNGVHEVTHETLAMNLDWQHLPEDIRKEITDKSLSEIKFSGDKIPKSFRSDLVRVFTEYRLNFESSISGKLAKKMDLGWKDLAKSSKLKVTGISATAGLAVGGLAYLAAKPKSWTETVKKDNDSEKSRAHNH